MRDANISRKIVRLLEIASTDAVLEIGPGPGALTGLLLENRPARLVAVEKDERFARERMAAGKGELSVLLADALLLPWERFSAPWKFIGNLPYNVASPLMWEIFSRASGLVRAVFMVQKEVGQRLIAGADSSAYGALSVWAQSFVRPRLEFIVPPTVFVPRPKVDSAVLSFTPLEPEKRLRLCTPAALAQALRICFQMRRKQLGTILKSLGKSPELLERLGTDSRLRPENLSPSSFQRLAGAGIFSGNH